MNVIINFLAVLCFVFLSSTSIKANDTCSLHYKGLEDNNEVDILSAKNRFKRKDFIVLTNVKPVPGDYVLSLISSKVVDDPQFRPFLCFITLGDQCKSDGGKYKFIEKYTLAKVNEDGSHEILEHLDLELLDNEVGSRVYIADESKNRASKLVSKIKTCHYY